MLQGHIYIELLLFLIRPFIKLAGSEHFRESLDEFEFRPNCILYFHCPESAPNVTENLRLMIVEYFPLNAEPMFKISMRKNVYLFINVLEQTQNIL